MGGWRIAKAESRRPPRAAGRPSKGKQPLVRRSLLALLGLGLVGVGVAAIFTTNSGTGSGILVGIGSLLVLFGAFSDQLESLRYGDLEIKLLHKADEAASRGDLEEARTLKRAADIVGQRARKTATAYRSVRGGMPVGSERTRKMDAIIADARTDAHARDLDEEEVLSLLWTGSEGARVWALGVLQERPELVTPRAVLDAILHPDQMFDQYQALVLADKFIKYGTSAIWTLERVGEAAHRQLHSGKLGTDRDSLSAARQILKDVPQRMEEEARKQSKQIKRPRWADCPECISNGQANQ